MLLKDKYQISEPNYSDRLPPAINNARPKYTKTSAYTKTDLHTPVKVKSDFVT